MIVFTEMMRGNALTRWLFQTCAPGLPLPFASLSYHEARERQERSLARRAVCPAARRVHLRLAALHRLAAQRGDDVSRPSPIERLHDIGWWTRGVTPLPSRPLASVPPEIDA